MYIPVPAKCPFTMTWHTLLEQYQCNTVWNKTFCKTTTISFQLMYYFSIGNNPADPNTIGSIIYGGSDLLLFLFHSSTSVQPIFPSQLSQKLSSESTTSLMRERGGEEKRNRFSRKWTGASHYCQSHIDLLAFSKLHQNVLIFQRICREQQGQLERLAWAGLRTLGAYWSGEWL